MGQYGLSISVVMSAGSRSTGSLPCGSADRASGDAAVELVELVEPLPGSSSPHAPANNRQQPAATIAIRLMPIWIVA